MTVQTMVWPGSTRPGRRARPGAGRRPTRPRRARRRRPPARRATGTRPGSERSVTLSIRPPDSSRASSAFLSTTRGCRCEWPSRWSAAARRVPRRRSRERAEHRREPRVRVDLCDLPDRPGHPRLPDLDRPLGRQVALIEAYAKEQGLWHDPSREATYSETIELDLSTVVPQHRRTEATAGPDRADRRQVGLPRRSAGLRRPSRGRPDAWATASRRPTHRRRTRAQPEADAPERRPPTARDRAGGCRSRWPTAPRPSSTTAPSRSRRSPRAPTRRTRR